MQYEKIVNGYLLSNDKDKLQQPVIHHYLSTESYWAQQIPSGLVAEMITGSECFGIYLDNKQVGFGRVITDNAIFGYLADIFILKEHRGKGLSKELLAFILAYGPFKNFRWFMLATKDAHGLYEKFGFTALPEPGRYMQLKKFDSYN
jgi:GNAT superfamily N-acetyltransferase